MKKTVLVCGASFAGLSTAYWMRRLGYDVTVVEIGPTLCDSCMERPVTHYVMLDMRITGSMTAVAECCEACAEEFATDLRASLPAAESTSGSTT